MMKIRARFRLLTISSPGAAGRSIRNACSTGAGWCFTETPYNSKKMSLKSFIDVSPDSHFPIQNLPFGIFQPRAGKPRAGVAIGDLVADLSVLEELGHFRSPEFHNQRVFSEDSLNSLLALGRPAWRKTREILQH